MYINMENLECHVNPEGKGFLAYVDLGKDENGKRVRPKVRGRTEDEAVAKLEKKLRDMGYVRQTAEAPKVDIIINEFTSIPDFVREYRVNAIIQSVENEEIDSRTAEQYINMLKPFEEYFKNVTVGDITVGALNCFFRAKEEETKDGEYRYSQVSLKNFEYHVHKMFKRAVENKWIVVDPFCCKGLKRPKSKKVTKKIEGFTSEEMRGILEVLKPNPILYAPVALMLNTGMRTQEVLGLRWKDIDFINNTIHIQQAVTVAVEFDCDGKIKKHEGIVGDTKTEGSNRHTGLTPEAREILLQWKEDAPRLTKTKMGEENFVFGSELKENYTYTAFRNKVNRYLAKAGIDGMRLHRCRHTVGTLLVAEGRTNIQGMKQLGITQDKTYLRYTEASINEKIMSGNVQAIRRGLSEKEVPKTKETIIQELLQEADKLTDSTAKLIIKSMAMVALGE